MSPKSCDLIFTNNSNKKYYSGDTVTGKVIVTTKKIFNFNEMKLVFYGNSKCHWREGSGDNSTSYSAKETHFDSYIKTILGNNNVLPVGTHTFDFTFKLPRYVPSSFIGAHGRVKYAIKVIFTQSFGFNSKYKFIFDVIEKVDLNEHLYTRAPIERSVDKKFYTLIFNNGILKANFQIPRSGYVSGQSILLNYQLQNDSKTKIENVKIKLIKTVTYHASKNEKKEIKSVAKTTSIGVEKQKHIKCQTHLDLPVLLPSTQNQNPIIEFSYELLIIVVVPGMHLNVDLKIPITIGTIPLDIS